MTPTSILFLASFVTAVALPSPVCERCLCTTRAPTWPGIDAEVPGQYAAAEAVFLGTVQQLGVDSTGAFAEFRVTQRWKGAAASSIRIGLPGNGTSCELHLKVGEEWLVFAQRDSTGYLWTGQCTLTVQRAQAGFVIAALNANTSMFSESAELYDAIYSTFKDYSAEADTIAALVRTTHPGAQSVLDVACGTGEHAKHLRTRHGFAVDGLDLDPGLLALARQKSPDAHFVVADMAAFDLGRRYDVVACMFSSIGYLKTIDRVTAALRCFRRHLNSGGVVIVEPWFPPGVLRIGQGVARQAEVNGIRVERESHTAVTGNISTLTFTYRIDQAGNTRTAEETHELGLFTTAEMLESFRDAGFFATHDPVGFNDRGLYVARSAAPGP